MSSNFDWEWTGNQKRWTEDERKKMQEAFDYFHQSKEWDMICVIYEVDDCFDIVIRDEEDINCRCLHGEVWEKAYLTPEQLKSIQEEQQRLEQKKEEVPPEEQSENTYQWGMICRDTGLRMDGRITARSPEEAERILRRDKYHMNTDGYNSWTTTNASLRGAVTESMMISQLAAKHPSGQIRILSASYGKTVVHTVRYQMKRGKSAWTNGTVTLNNALTESMARNQLKAKFPGATIRILSFVKKK